MECLPAQHKAATPSAQVVISRYIIPCAFAVGIVGNLLNLLVLNGRRMRCKTNYFLSAMAVADMGFFFIMTLYDLPTFPSIAASPGFNKIYTQAKMTLTALANWFSTSSTWLAIAVTCERLLAISKPLHASLWLKKKWIIAMIIFIFVASFPLFAYTFVWHTPIQRTINRCNVSITVWTIREINQTEHPWLHRYVDTSLKIVPHISITIPLFILIVLNMSLLYSLYQSRRQSSKMTLGTQHNKIPEFRIALMVAVTIGSFLLFQTPSGVLYIWDAVNGSRNRPSWFYLATYVSNKLVIIGKTLNFILYCASSKNFRSQLFQLFQRRKMKRGQAYRKPPVSSSYRTLRVVVEKSE